MKKNLFLFCVLIVLLAITWWFQERGGQVQRELIAKREQVLSDLEVGSLQAIKLKNATIHAADQKYSIGENKIPAHEGKVNEFFNTLNQLAAIRFLTDEEVATLDQSLAFPETTSVMTFVTSTGERVFRIGAALRTSSDQFYASIDNKFLIVSDRKPLIEAHQEHEEIALRDQRLRTIFNLPQEFFYETKLLTTQARIVEIKFESQQYRPYVVNFEESETTPKPIHQLSYDQEEFAKYHKALSDVEAVNLLPSFDPNLLKDFRATLNLRLNDGTSITYSLFVGYGSLPGYFVLSSTNQYLYEFDQSQAGLFFQNVQDFWQLIPVPKQERFSLRLYDKSLDFSFEVILGKEFDLIAKRPMPRLHRARLMLLSSLFTTRAQYVTKVSDAKILGFQALFKIEVDQKTWEFAETSDEWMLIDHSRSLAYHYKKNDALALKASLSDYLETQP